MTKLIIAGLGVVLCSRIALATAPESVAVAS